MGPADKRLDKEGQTNIQSNDSNVTIDSLVNGPTTSKDLSSVRATAPMLVVLYMVLLHRQTEKCHRSCLLLRAAHCLLATRMGRSYHNDCHKREESNRLCLRVLVQV